MIEATDDYLMELLGQSGETPAWLTECDLSPTGEEDRAAHGAFAKRRRAARNGRSDDAREIELPADLRHERKAKAREFLDALDVSNAARHLQRLPAKGATLHCIAKGNYPSWDLVPAVLKLAAPATIESLYVVTLSFNNGNADELVAMLDSGAVGRVTLLASCYFKDSSEADYAYLADALAQRGHRIMAMRVHAKLLLFALSDGRRLTVESSANLRSCRAIEQFCITHDRELYEFHAAWIERMTAEAMTKPQ